MNRLQGKEMPGASSAEQSEREIISKLVVGLEL